MLCPTCRREHLHLIKVLNPSPPYRTGPASAKFTSLTTFNKGQLKLALHLNSTLSRECRHSFEACRIAALNAYDGFKRLTDLYTFRYKAMCPQPDAEPYAELYAESDPESNAEPNNTDPPPTSIPTPPLLAASTLHSASIDHLLNWPITRPGNTPAMSHPSKIPAEILSFIVDQAAYEAYVTGFQEIVDEYVEGVYGAYQNAKKDVEERVRKSEMGAMNRRMWRQFWEEVFLAENEKWEGDLQNLVLPSWDEIVDELYRAILERVEGAEELMGLILGCEREEGEEDDGDYYDGCE